MKISANKPDCYSEEEIQDFLAFARAGGEPKTRSPTVKALKEKEQLQQEVRRLEKENDLLKKWQRYLAEAHQNDLASSRGTRRN